MTGCCRCAAPFVRFRNLRCRQVCRPASNSALDADRPEADVRAGGRPARRDVSRQRSWSFQALAAAAVFGAVISSSVMLTIERYDQREDVARQVVAGHIRGQLATQPFDIASSDRHTVKPWFTSRLPESPQVPDLAAQGFVLVGGRVDVVGHDPVATIVYKHAAHTVSLTTLPPGQSVSDQAIAGYNVRSWSDAAVHLHCSFGLAQRRSCNIRAGIFCGIAGAGNQIDERSRPDAPPARAKPKWAVW